MQLNILIYSRVVMHNMVTPEQLKWNAENDHSVEEYLKKLEKGEIQTVVARNLKDLVKTK